MLPDHMLQGLSTPAISLSLSLYLSFFLSITQEQLKSLQSGFKHVNDGDFHLQSNHLTMDLDNNININMPPCETKVLIIQRAWRDFLQRQEVEKRSPSPPSLSSSDKMSMSISMMTLSDGSTPVSMETYSFSSQGAERKCKDLA
ncbi:IQ domain-containing protein J-like [Scomber scombrus]|uniref:IQ domain-containing protein J-like n=1 Tax=Scomber scombrus TaxID=13677 RepID=UPI002DDA852A|nr:IQ domain-containing protein J-like [Scomber scombrus]